MGNLFGPSFFRTHTRLLAGTLALITMAGCGKHPKTFSPTATDNFTFQSIDAYGQAGALYQADYLMVFDPSYSYLSNKTVLENSIKSFTAKLRSEGIDYRVGFVNGNVQSTCSNKSSCIQTSFLGGVLTPSMGSSAETSVISKIAQPLSPNHSMHLEATDKALAANPTFLRNGSQLVIVLISDSDDNSSGTAASWATKFKSYKPNAGYVSARAIVYGASASCPVSGTFGTSSGTRIAAAATAADHLGTNVVQCITSDFASSLENLAVNVTVPTDRFVLQQTAVPGSVSVYVGGSLQTLATDFNFSQSSNEVVFQSSAIPPLGASVELHYEPSLVLSGHAVADSIQVFVNGNQVNRSNSDGFAYIASDNRIMLYGSAAVQKSSVRVTYELAP